MNWNNLRYFLAIAEHGSLSAAARSVNISQATMWRKAFELETELDTQLFISNKKGYRLTPAGARLLPIAKEMQNNASQALTSMKEADGLKGSITITAPDILAHLLLTHLVQPLASEYPDLVIELITASPSIPLLHQDTDIAISPAGTKNSELEPWGTYPIKFAVYGSQRYVQKYGKPKSPQDYPHHYFIDFEQTNAQMAPSGWFKKIAKGKIATKSNNPHFRKAAAQQGLGLTLLPCLFVDSNDDLVEVISHKKIGSLDLLLLINKKQKQQSNTLFIQKRLMQILKGI